MNSIILPSSFSHTEEQTQIISAARDTNDNLMVQALAGTGKTTTLCLLAEALPAVPSLALAFNVKIKKELEKRFPSHFTVKTLNGLGHGAWSSAIGKRLILEDKKLGTIISSHFKDIAWSGPKDDWDYVRRLVGAAMNAGLVPNGFAAKGLMPDTKMAWMELAFNACGHPDEALIPLAHEVLCQSIRMSIAGTITFDDQIYMSALFGGVFPKFPIVMVDEAQDLSPLNHIMLSKTTPLAGRLIVVGDKHQSIYGFRGADTNSMAKIKRLKSNWTDLTLTLTFRCPKIVVERQWDHVPSFRAHTSNHDGFFLRLRRPDEVPPEEPFWRWSDIQTFRQEHGAQSVAVICRNNAPLLSTAFRLIRQGIGCQMLGRDIGKSLVTLLKKIVKDPETPVKECIELISEWERREVSQAQANGNDSKVDAANDRAECLLATIDSAMSVNKQRDIVARLEEIFSSEGGLVDLMTIHRSKGLEYDLVIFLDSWLIPRKGSEGAELQQELNLRYVAETRCKKVLILANSADLAQS